MPCYDAPMRRRIACLLTFAALFTAACGGDDDAGDPTDGTGPTASEATGATGSAEIAQFTVVVQDVEGGNTLSFAGVSCEGIDGPYDVTIAVQGNFTGESTATFAFDEEGAGTMEWSMDASGADGTATLSGTYAVEISPVQETQVIIFSGVTMVEGPSGHREIDVTTEDVPVEEGTGACEQ
jgi:hypothetical protein